MGIRHSVNRVELIGHMGKDPEAKTASNGRLYVTFSVATTERWKDKQGQKQEDTQWHSVVCWNEGLCKIIADYAHKGDAVHVVGSLKTRKYIDKQGAERYATDVVVQGPRHEFGLLTGPNAGGGKSGGGGYDRGEPAAPSGYGSETAEERPAARGGAKPAEFDDDVPF